MIKDRGQKALVLRYVVGKRWFPQLELDVIPELKTSQQDMPITDIDLLASIPDEFEGFRRVLFDCKTGRKESVVTRALWQRGMIEYMGASRGICIFKKDVIEPDHRHLSAQFNVLILNEQEFHNYAIATGVPRDAQTGHIGILDNWDKFFDIPNKYPVLNSLVQFSKSKYWILEENQAVRDVIAITIDYAGEMDPSKPEHLAIFGDLVSLLMYSLSKIVAVIFARYLQPKERADLSNALLFLIYGGRESYEHRNRLQKMILEARAPERKSVELNLPSWNPFLQLVRQGLDAPTEISKAPLILRELAWGFLSHSANVEFADVLASESPQAAKLAMLGVEYLGKAAMLPPEFVENYLERLLYIQRPRNRLL